MIFINIRWSTTRQCGPDSTLPYSGDSDHRSRGIFFSEDMNLPILNNIRRQINWNDKSSYELPNLHINQNTTAD